LLAQQQGDYHYSYMNKEHSNIDQVKQELKQVRVRSRLIARVSVSIHFYDLSKALAKL